MDNFSVATEKKKLITATEQNEVSKIVKFDYEIS